MAARQLGDPIGGWNEHEVGVSSQGVATIASGSDPSFHTIRSGKPSGRAASDHVSNSGLRVSTTSFPGSYRSITYGPVAGMVSPSASASGLPAGTANAKGIVRAYGKSGSGARRWKVTVPASSSAMIPLERSQGSPGASSHSRAGRRREVGNPSGWVSIGIRFANTRSIARRKSSGEQAPRRVPEPVTKLERVRAAAVGGFRERPCHVGDERRALEPRCVRYPPGRRW